VLGINWDLGGSNNEPRLPEDGVFLVMHVQLQ